MAEHWFEPKTHGYGAVPTSWRGWALTLGFVALSSLLVLVFVLWPLLHGRAPGAWGIATYLVAMAVATFAFIRICRRKTRGEWRWRWGERV
jgi:hypothetical protein